MLLHCVEELTDFMRGLDAYGKSDLREVIDNMRFGQPPAGDDGSGRLFGNPVVLNLDRCPPPLASLAVTSEIYDDPNRIGTGNRIG